LQLDGLVAKGKGLGAELDTNGNVVCCSGLVLDELEDDAAFADSWVREGVPVSPMTMNLKR
jgi:hypothetical protein